MIAFVVTPGFEAALMSELTGRVSAPTVAAPGVVSAEVMAPGEPLPDPIFARQLLPDARRLSGPSVSALAEAAYAALESAVDAGTGPFTLHAYAIAPGDADADDNAVAAPAPAPAPGMGSRIELIGRQTLALLQKRRRRAFARYQPADAFAAIRDANATLLQLLALDRTTMLASAASPAPLPGGGFTLAPWPGGAAPVTVDRAPPSRAYQKLEEAFLWMNAAPGPGDVCVDLGAAPGGWTMTALKRGARVIAVDRAALQAPAAPHPLLTMTIGNAFTFEPSQPVDWLLCDVICEPPRTIALIETWLTRRWCRHLVCTVKFKGSAGYGVLAPLGAFLAGAGLRFARIKQLAHNKNEVTVMGIR
ncbi:MAG: rRNA (cytidine2498-2-O)-methyltransferase [Myxococcales bacterium]|nr:rRNA (cytidine2498-2-O)-methyltransferase [Myxococcales bacterium]